jgi:hypothetical protein
VDPSPPALREGTGERPPAQPVAAATAATPAVIDAIQNLVDRYLRALTDLDVEEAKAVWPGVNETALRRVFTSLDEQQFELNGCDIAVAGRSANASCDGVVRYVPKVGSKTMFVQRRRWTFQLRNNNSRWFIDNVQTR